MSKLLFIAYYFPPIGGGGVQRSLKFVKYLPEHGITPLVLTASPPPASHWAPSDPRLQHQLPEAVQIFRTPAIGALQRDCRRQVRLRNWLGLTSPFGLEWRRYALELGSRLCREHRPKAIFVTMSPFEGAEIGARLSAMHGLPWIADLRDPWALDEMQVFSSRFHRWLASRDMRRQLQSASLIIMNTPEAARRLREAFPEFRPKHVVALTNGFDAEDFSAPLPRTRNERFTIVHTGTLHSANGNLPPWRRALLEAIGRIPAGVDTYCRSHAHLLTALEHWAQAAPEIRDRVRLVLAGVIAASDRALVTRSSVASMVEFTGYCSHAETVRRQRTADLLFLPMHKMPPGSRATIVPGKTYEYLASDRPILAAIPAGDARDFLLRSGTGLVCEPDDVGQMRRILAAQYRRWADGQPHPGVDPDFLQQFERRELTRQLAGHLTALDPSLTGGSPSVPVGIYGPVR